MPAEGAMMCILLVCASQTGRTHEDEDKNNLQNSMEGTIGHMKLKTRLFVAYVLNAHFTRDGTGRRL